MFLLVGLVLLIHSCYATIRYRQYTMLLEEQMDGLPLDIVLECLFGLVVSCWGTVLYAGQFQPIKISSHLAKKTFDTLNHRPSLITFAHRGPQFAKTATN
eukprot:TRINITY_DN12424_c0_g1_i3.p1 TRINITY_DN12424_c0_g1~~TRINITY_DN12424_c0_g1_i3.p1  ORF type:complete len:108 (+),score=22.98 TRINITY_DN12424_c0_g1_i3:26-325(+)